MKRLLIILPFIVLLGSATCFAGDYEDGWAAHKRGDYKTALPLFTRAANKGNALAQTTLGLLYYNGRGVSQDYEQAIMWLRKAADQGQSGAQLLLGEMYEQGKGSPQNYAEAYKWYSLAAADSSLDKEVRDIAIKGRDNAAEKIKEVQNQAQQSQQPDAKACLRDQKHCGE
jgi:hypothetical protein